MGMLTAHPSFYVAVDQNGELMILNIRRMGYKDVYLDHIQYKDHRFVTIVSLPMQ